MLQCTFRLQSKIEPQRNTSSILIRSQHKEIFSPEKCFQGQLYSKYKQHPHYSIQCLVNINIKLPCQALLWSQKHQRSTNKDQILVKLTHPLQTMRQSCEGRHYIANLRKKNLRHRKVHNFLKVSWLVKKTQDSSPGSVTAEPHSNNSEILVLLLAYYKMYFYSNIT